MSRRLPLLVMSAGLVGLVLGLSKLHAAAVADNGYDFTSSSRFGWAIAYAGLLVLSAYAAGLPDVPRRPRQIVASAIVAPAAAGIGMSLVQLALGTALLPRFVVAGTALLAVPWLIVCAAVASGGRSRAEYRDRVVVIGRSEDAASLAHELDGHPERPASVVAVLDPTDAALGAVGPAPIVTTVRDEQATVVVLDRVAQADQTIVDQVAMLHETGVRVRTLSLFYDEWLGKLPASELERVSLMFDIGEVHRLRYGRLKRLTDLAVGIAALPVLALIVPVVLLGNLTGNRGPLLYRQQRVGKRGRDFEILKFRSMVEATGPTEWTADDDVRVTPFGGFLRRTHLDELPQVLNILRGDLSVVGPRPEQRQYVEELTTKLPYYDLRHLVQPGLTGWAQVKYGYAGSSSDALEKLQYEFWYLRHQRLAVDLRIIARTLRSVVSGDGR